MSFIDWKNSALGRLIDIDGAYGDQCVDVAMDYAQYIFPGHRWPQLIGYGNAKDLFNASSADYFEKITNNHADVNQQPIQGDIVIYDKTATNPYGHVGICDSANSGGVNLIQQDGFLALDAAGNAHGACFEVYRPWGRSPCIGWLRPRQAAPPPPPVPTTTTTLPPPVTTTTTLPPETTTTTLPPEVIPEPVVVPELSAPVSVDNWIVKLFKAILDWLTKPIGGSR